MGTPSDPHRPVLLEACLRFVARPGSVLVDATVGPGGHAEGLLEAVGPAGRVYGIDRDPEAVAFATRRLADYGDRFVGIRGDYRDLVELLAAHGVFAVDGVVCDLGISSMQLDDPKRGFAFRHDAPLDMRMNASTGPTAAELLATLPESELKRILLAYGEERKAGPIARAIVRERASSPIRTTRQLASLVERVVGAGSRRSRIDPATRSFQALRIAVNRELEGLEGFVTDAVSLLKRGGRLAVISFHSLEDRAIKSSLRSLAKRCICPPKLPVCACGRENLVKILTPRPLRPSPEDVRSNPRCRSARMRVAERI